MHQNLYGTLKLSQQKLTINLPISGNYNYSKKLKNAKSLKDIPTIYLKSEVESNEIIDELIKLYDVISLT